MSILSREIGGWIQSQPGLIAADTEEDLWMKALSYFVAARRWKTPVTVAEFQINVASRGYRVESRSRPGKPSEHYPVLALPEKHRGF